MRMPPNAGFVESYSIHHSGCAVFYAPVPSRSRVFLQGLVLHFVMQLSSVKGLDTLSPAMVNLNYLPFQLELWHGQSHSNGLQEFI